ncbi:[FeFe] hydrogenase H-cluster maturation GTPase HydF [Bacteroides difficilis]|uniref:[FeFe] hydrogenase H-cluster maturation GTPase HydF n=1 Tax=Bacteroides difficilis TaxID=2763021 RepID=A0ABR7CAG5_9BACE|nr:[FeFe] hydrogenase H-cluster maturation GTPase HydF [Bacteroides difficilis]MBC5604802.1 [FeFe] hydrogenase H-cluster maturation GTPase HydF [Bacteroides difficilis]
MSLTDTPNANRLHIALFGRRNSGKSSLINALTGQDTALVSDTPGTTTDLVSKAMEIQGIGPCLFIDTPGFDDEGELGELRVSRTLKAIEKTDIALLLCGDTTFSHEKEMLALLKKKNIPVIPVLNKIDIRENSDSLATYIEKECKIRPLLVSAKEEIGIEQIRQAILEKLPSDFGQQSITGELTAENDLVLLVMPQDIQAPRGRLILPQVQTIRELLDKKCLVVSCTTDKLTETLQALARPPKLIITDSQVFKAVYEQKPEESKLTSFSVLFAGYKGDIHYYVESAAVIESLTEASRVLIAEACTHAPLTEDIGRVKLPRLLRKRIGEKLQIDIVGGTDFPQELTPYDLIIHCGACMFNRKYVLSRIERAREQHIPMTNYGVAIAYLNGILDQIEY